MSSKSISEASALSAETCKSGWGKEDSKVRVTGMHLRVLRGQPVWPLAFHQLVVVRDWRAFVEQHLEGCDFLAVPCEPRSLGARHLEEVLSWY